MITHINIKDDSEDTDVVVRTMASSYVSLDLLAMLKQESEQRQQILSQYSIWELEREINKRMSQF